MLEILASRRASLPLVHDGEGAEALSGQTTPRSQRGEFREQYDRSRPWNPRSRADRLTSRTAVVE